MKGGNMASGIQKATPQNAGTSFDKTSVSPAVDYKMKPQEKSSWRKDIVKSSASNSQND